MNVPRRYEINYMKKKKQIQDIKLPKKGVEITFTLGKKTTGYKKALDIFCYLVTCAALSLILVVFALAWIN